MKKEINNNRDYFRIIDISKDIGCLDCGLFSMMCLDGLSDEEKNLIFELDLSKNGLVFDKISSNIKLDNIIFVCRIEDSSELEELLNPTDPDNTVIKIETEHSTLIYNKEE